MKLLLVHDRTEVVSEIVDMLSHAGIGDYQLEIAEDGVSARSALQKEFYDLAIFDLTIPRIKGRDDPDFSVAEGLFEELFQTDSLNTPGDLIGLTRDADALERINTKIGPHLMAIVEERPGSGWKTLLGDRVRYAANSTRSRQRSVNTRFDYDALIVTALDEEFRPYREIFEFHEIPHSNGVHEFLFEDRAGVLRRGVAYSIGRSGQASAAAQTAALIGQYRPRICLMSGLCGGVKDKVNIGDILIFESVFDWDYGKWKSDPGGSVFYPRPEPMVIRNSRTHQVARELVETGLAENSHVLAEATKATAGRLHEVKILLVPAGSGSAVVADAELMSRIGGMNENIQGIDMEAYGFYFAAAHTHVVKPDVLCVKAVADFCDREKSDDFHQICSFLSANVIKEILKTRWDFDPPACAR